MAGRSRINRMLNLLETKNENNSILFTEKEQLSPEKLRPDSPKPGCSKYLPEFQIVDDVLPGNFENATDIEEIADNFFTDTDESYMACVDILFSLVDSLPCFYVDYSSGSDNDYVPDTEGSSDSEGNRYPNPARENVVIPDSDPEENNSFWERVGLKEGRKRKPRKSKKERRKDREERKRRRNLGQEYKTNTGKEVKKREFQMLGDCRMNCAENIPEEFRHQMFKNYWSLGEYNRRVQFIANLIQIQEKKTQKVHATKKRQFANTYYLTLQTESYKICFLKTFNETSKFVQIVTDKLKVSEGLVLDSERGKQPSITKISDERLETVKNHILSFPAFESHYGRSKSKKKFLAPHLCLADMYNAYQEVTENPVSQTIYSWVFKSQNLSFKKPYLDTCIKCDKLDMEIKVCKDEEKIAKEKLKLAHVKEAESIYDRKTSEKELSIASSDTLVAAFDLQQCLPTPYLKSGAVFYKRQLWTFNLTIRNCTTNKSY